MKQFDERAFALAIAERYPHIPAEAEALIIAREANRPIVGSLSAASQSALAIAAVAGYVRHKLTNYDALLARMMRHQARDKVRQQVTRIMFTWEGH